MFQALKAKGTPGGMALGHATGDSGWTQWLMWAFGGKLVDKNNKVVIDSPETLKALEYGKELYATFAPGTLSWLDPNNNKAFLDSQISVTNNGISIYYAAKNSTDPKVKEMARHPARLVPGRAGGRAHRVPPVLQPDGVQAHQVPEGRQGIRALHDGRGAVRPLDGSRRRLHLAAAARLREEPGVDRRPQAHAVPRLGQEHAAGGYEGKLGYASAGALADFIVQDMVAEAVSGSKTPKEAMQRASPARRALLQGLRPAPDPHAARAPEQPQRPRAGFSCCPRRCCCCCS
jgi:multiple sugar transport system substrate-binding protein